ncbi:IS66 family transposase, partial [Aeromonas caviae]
MKMTPKNLTPSPNLSGLSAAELLAVIAGFQQQLALKEEAIQRRDAHILLLEELLRLRRIQR